MAKNSSTKRGDLFIGESGQLRLTGESVQQQAVEGTTGEYFGMTFANDEKRLNYFTGKGTSQCTLRPFRTEALRAGFRAAFARTTGQS